MFYRSIYNSCPTQCAFRLVEFMGDMKTTKVMKELQEDVLTENSMFFLSWLTALGSGTGSVCLMTDTDSPEEERFTASSKGHVAT